MLRPIEKRTVSDQVYEQLREAIVRGTLPPGSELPGERSLSVQMQVNRGAVREALKRLEQSRLVTIRQGESTRVLDFCQTARLDLISTLLITSDGSLDLEVARSVIELRAAITPDIVRLAAEREGAAMAPLLKPILDEMESRHEDVEALARLSEEFWRQIVRASGNVAYMLVFNTVTEVHHRFRHLLAPLLAKAYGNLGRFQTIAAAIIAGQPSEARRAAEAHVTPIVSRLGGQLRTLRRDGSTHWQPDAIAPSDDETVD